MTDRPITIHDPIIGPPRGSANAAWKFYVGQTFYRRLLEGQGEAVDDYFREVYRLAPLVGIDPAIVVAQSALETGNWGAIPGAGATAWLKRNNPGSIGVTSTGKPGEPDIDAGHTWEDGTDAARGQIVHLFIYASQGPTDHDVWAQHLRQYVHLDPRYWNVVNAGYAGSVRLLADLGNGKWAADPDYAAKIAARGNQIFGFKETPMPTTYPSYPVLVSQRTGQTITVESPVPIVQKIIPISAARPGTALVNPRFWVQHETGNPSVGADDEMHWRFLMGQLGTQTSFHFCTSSKRITQLVPLLEVTWQSADGAGPGNMSSWSNEGCINADGDEAAMRRNSEWLAAGVLKGMAALGYSDGAATTDDVKRHWDFNYNNAPAHRHHCPDNMMNDGYWPTFVANVGTLLSAPPEPVQEYAMPIILDLGVWDGKDRTLPDGTVMRACKRTITARTRTKRYQVAATDAPSIGPDLNRGESADIEYVFQAKKGGARWGYTTWGTRLRLAHFDPYIIIQDKG